MEELDNTRNIHNGDDNGILWSRLARPALHGFVGRFLAWKLSVISRRWICC